MIVNLTPHAVALFDAKQVGDKPRFYRTSGGVLRVANADGNPLGYSEWNGAAAPARAAESKTDVELLGIRELVEAEPENYIGERKVPTRRVLYGEVAGLPAPDLDTFYVVSLLVVQAAKAQGRTTADLLTPGDLVRDEKGEIAGCTSFYRW